jgi:Uma2 family endonuclease
MLASYKKSLRAVSIAIFISVFFRQSIGQSGNSTSVTGTVVDPSGAVVPDATVEIQNPVSGSRRDHRRRGKVHLY